MKSFGLILPCLALVSPAAGSDPDESDVPFCDLVPHIDPSSLQLADVVAGRDLSFTYANETRVLRLKQQRS